MELAGVPAGTVEELPRAARTAGLEVVEADGFFVTANPELGFGLHAATMAATRDRAAHSGIAVGLALAAEPADVLVSL
jgi:hypothetical protein